MALNRLAFCPTRKFDSFPSPPFPSLLPTPPHALRRDAQGRIKVSEVPKLLVCAGWIDGYLRKSNKATATAAKAKTVAAAAAAATTTTAAADNLRQATAEAEETTAAAKPIERRIK